MHVDNNLYFLLLLLLNICVVNYQMKLNEMWHRSIRYGLDAVCLKFKQIKTYS